MIRATVLLMGAALVCALPLHASEGPCDNRHFCTVVEDAASGARLVGENLNQVAPVTVKLWPQAQGDDLRKDRRDHALPTVVIDAGTRKVLMPLKRDADGVVEDLPLVDWTFGDYRATPNPDKPHLLPWPQKVFFGKLRYFVSQGCDEAFSHNGNRANATDFSMPEGAHVAAARGGVVFEVEEHFDKGGEDEALVDAANVVQILHEDGSISMYAHLQKDGALVDEGDHVIAGDVIGLAGNTGFSTGPHLHFERYIAGEDGFILSLPTRFRHWGGEVSCPKTGSSLGAK